MFGCLASLVSQAAASQIDLLGDLQRCPVKGPPPHVGGALGGGSPPTAPPTAPLYMGGVETPPMYGGRSHCFFAILILFEPRNTIIMRIMTVQILYDFFLNSKTLNK